jgi:hypothetical protein
MHWKIFPLNIKTNRYIHEISIDSRNFSRYKSYCSKTFLKFHYFVWMCSSRVLKWFTIYICWNDWTCTCMQILFSLSLIYNLIIIKLKVNQYLKNAEYTINKVNLYLLVNVLSVLRFTDSDYSFSIFKLFLKLCKFIRIVNKRIWSLDWSISFHNSISVQYLFKYLLDVFISGVYYVNRHVIMIYTCVLGNQFRIYIFLLFFI